MGGASGGGENREAQRGQELQNWYYKNRLMPMVQNLPMQQAYGGTAVPEFAPASQQAMGMQQERALAGSPLLPAAQQQNLATMRGDYLYGGPGFDQAFQAASRAITPQVQGAFERAGRFGGGLAQEAHTRALGDAFAGLYGQERGRQMTATGMAPGLAQADYADIGRLGQVGLQQEARERQMLEEEAQKHYFAQQAPYSQLGAVLPAYGGLATQPLSTGESRSSPWGGAAAGALTGAKIGSAIPGTQGWGTAIGAGLGGLGGFFGSM